VTCCQLSRKAAKARKTQRDLTKAAIMRTISKAVNKNGKPKPRRAMNQKVPGSKKGIRHVRRYRKTIPMYTTRKKTFQRLFFACIENSVYDRAD
jgi:hypothetical protein